VAVFGEQEKAAFQGYAGNKSRIPELRWKNQAAKSFQRHITGLLGPF
jgi:hypothetical protein